MNKTKTKQNPKETSRLGNKQGTKTLYRNKTKQKTGEVLSQGQTKEKPGYAE